MPLEATQFQLTASFKKQ